MNSEIKEKWLAALRSGKYQKGQNSLRSQSGSDNLYCCLGVLCEIHMEETKEGTWYDNNAYGIDISESQRGYLPRSVKDWAGLKTWNAEFTLPEGHEMASLAGVNDRKEGYPGYDPTFNTVIQYIEKYF